MNQNIPTLILSSIVALTVIPACAIIVLLTKQLRK